MTEVDADKYQACVRLLSIQPTRNVKNVNETGGRLRLYSQGSASEHELCKTSSVCKGSYP